MKHLSWLLIITTIFISCGISNKTNSKTSKNNLEETVVIENDSLEYKIIITDIGFSTYLHSIAKPANFYSQKYYENKNVFYVNEWNRRASNPIQYGSFYESTIDYNPNINYGLEVNYKLYNYFKFIDYKYGIRLR